MTKALQPSLSAGELAPGLHGRVDIARYAIAVKGARNVVVRPTGGMGKRTGTIFNGVVKAPTLAHRLLPFVYSTEVRYLIEVGNLYFRFWYLDASNRLFALESSPGVPVEVVTPYLTADLEKLRITQSADVLFISGVNAAAKIPPKELRRLTPTSFELVDHNNRLGPFRSINGDEAARMAVTGVTGNITISCNRDVFTAAMVGSYVYLEEKELRAVKPWTPLEKNIPVGTLRRSDGKVFKCVSVPTPSGMGTPYYICGNTKPTHEQGRAFDGPQDSRDDGVNAYSVGVEWEYLHAGYGIAKITSYTSAFAVNAVVVLRMPDSVVGTAPAPVAGSPWTLNGDGVTKTFAVVGASSDTQADYTVTISGEAVQPNPYYTPVPGTGGDPGSGSLGDNRGNGAYAN